MADLHLWRAKNPNIHGRWILVGKIVGLNGIYDSTPGTDRMLLVNADTGGINTHFLESEIEPYPGPAPPRKPGSYPDA